MRDENKQSDRQSPENELERVLNAVLVEYTAAEQRPGLEERILTNLAIERTKAPMPGWLRWGWATAVAAGLLIASVLAWRSGKPQPVVIDHHSGAVVVARDEGNVGTHAVNLPPKVSVPNVGSHRPRPTVAIVVGPKLDQFPSRQPMSAQERELIRYVREFPDQAVLVARAQDEYRKELEKRIEKERAETESSDPDLQER
jgi:hypothetical protein